MGGRDITSLVGSFLALGATGCDFRDTVLDRLTDLTEPSAGAVVHAGGFPDSGNALLVSCINSDTTVITAHAAGRSVVSDIFLFAVSCSLADP